MASKDKEQYFANSSPNLAHRPAYHLRRLPQLRWLLGTLFSLTIAGVVLIHRNISVSLWKSTPGHAQRVLAECDALLGLPGPSADFHKRRTSDRFEPGTKDTLIVNATIWTGANQGKEVVHEGTIFLQNGIIASITSSTFTKELLSRLDPDTNIVNAGGAWVTPAIVDMHSHAGPWLRSVDGIDTHDLNWELSRAGGVGTELVLPGSANAIGGQAFVVKTRPTKERSTLSMLLEPPNNIVSNGSSLALRWRHIKHAAGENPSRVYSGTR
ncbi:hypothetical protein DL93DRAFT_214208 [Clavulina sp. PMI_390]|nr:hypothetical protein DL93DRAFT_214208 [Clavulina sp. PMI_390]